MNATQNAEASILASASADLAVGSSATRSYSSTLIPTLIAYSAFGVLTLGIIHSNGWLFALGLIVLLPAALILFAAPLTVYLGMRNMYRHPENYETQITEDADGNFAGIKWNRVR